MVKKEQKKYIALGELFESFPIAIKSKPNTGSLVFFSSTSGFPKQYRKYIDSYEK
jgi:hypothetical protein